MSQQHGVSPSLASIATAPPSNGTPSITTITSAPSADSSGTQSQTNGASSSVSQSSQPTRPSSTPSTKVHIPKLSAATTELLARVTGRLQGEPSPSPAGNDHNNFIRWMPSKFTHTLNNQNPGTTMKASSTIIELPTAPFVYSHHMGAVAASPKATTSQQQSQANHTPNTTASATLSSPGLVNIAPKPSGTPTPLAQTPPPSQIQLPTPSSIPPAKTSSPAYKPKKPSRPSTGSRPKKGTTNGAKRKKRKRGGDSDGEIIRAGDSSTDDDSDDVAPTATQTKSGRQVNRPSLYVPAAAPSPASAKVNGQSLDAASDGLQGGQHAAAAASRKRKRVFRKPKDANSINCMHCQRGHSPLSNPIVFCDECNRAWHQLCHDPPIDAEVVTIAEKEWLCHECKPVPRAIVQPTVVRSNPHLGSSALPLDPTIFPPTELPRLEVGGDGFSINERRGFLSCLSHATLVELLLALSSHNPTLPLFPANLRSLPSSQFPCPPSKLTTSTPSATTTPAANGMAIKPTPDPLPTPSSDRRRRYEESSDDEGSEYEVEDHRLYPRAGNGFSLSANLDDLDIMREDPACPTFSYALHGPAKSRLQTNHPSPLWREPVGS